MKIETYEREKYVRLDCIHTNGDTMFTIIASDDGLSIQGNSYFVASGEMVITPKVSNEVAIFFTDKKQKL